MPPKGKQQEKIPLKPITSCALNVSKYILGVGDGTIEIRYLLF
jgi:hypothetical protein